MIRSRINRWTCSKLADIIRGEKKPYALGGNEWEEWHEAAQKKHPTRYWIAETGLKKLQNIVYFPYDIYHTIKIYIRNRFIDKIHYLHTGLEPGQYYDLDYRILHGLFNELVDFIEVELAGMNGYLERKKRFKFVKGRSIESGKDYLEWACNLKYDEDYGISPDDPDFGKITPQAENYRIIRDLYNWWKVTRPNRPEPYVDGEYDDSIEESYENEDTEMLISLIKVRGSLWT